MDFRASAQHQILDSLSLDSAALDAIALDSVDDSALALVARQMQAENSATAHTQHSSHSSHSRHGSLW